MEAVVNADINFHVIHLLLAKVSVHKMYTYHDIMLILHRIVVPAYKAIKTHNLNKIRL